MGAAAGQPQQANIGQTGSWSVLLEVASHGSPAGSPGRELPILTRQRD
jgi:hypothetical protein